MFVIDSIEFNTSFAKKLETAMGKQNVNAQLNKDSEYVRAVFR